MRGLVSGPTVPVEYKDSYLFLSQNLMETPLRSASLQPQRLRLCSYYRGSVSNPNLHSGSSSLQV